jgi:signal transduction histidine kinase
VSTHLLTITDAATGFVLLGCAVPMGLRQRRLGIILAMAGLFWFIGDLAPALVLLHRGPLVQLLLSYPTGRVRRPLPVLTIAVAYAVALGGMVAGGPWLSFALAGLVALAALDVFRTRSGPARRAGVPALVSAEMFAAVVALGAANALLSLNADRLALLVYEAAICVVVCWLTVDLRYGRWSDATLAGLVTQLGARAEASGLEGELRRRLADPTLVLGLRDPDHDAYLDERGDVVESTDASVASPVLDGSEQVAVMLHDPVLLLDPALLEGATRAVSLAVANGRGRREVAARGASVAASSRRIVKAADAQRDRLRDELEHGAHHHLRQVASILEGLDDGASEQTRVRLRVVRAEVDQGLTELQQLATGIRPPALTTGGLALALRQLTSNLPFACKVTTAVGRLSPAVESTVYFTCTEALANIAKHADAIHATVLVVVEGQQVVARVIDDGRGGADLRGSGLRGLADRVSALGGQLSVVSPARAGTTVEARLPINEEVDS